MKLLKKALVSILLFVLLFNESTCNLVYGMDFKGANNEIDKYIYERKETTAGVSIAYFGKDEVVKKDFGFMNRDTKEEVSKDSVFEWGSCSKLLVWVSLMKLHEEGKVDFNNDISTYLPKDFLKYKDKSKKITIIDLMNHKAGFQELLFIPEVKEEDKLRDLDDALKYYEPKVIYEPNSITSYSNYGSAIGAYIVENVSGIEFYEYVKKQIFNPLGMSETSIRADLSDNITVKNRRSKNKSYIIMDNINEDLGVSNAFIELYPAGSAIGTMDDFIKFSKSLLKDTEESKRIFKDSKTIDLLFTPTDYYGDTNIPKNAHGLWYLPYGEGVYGHGGNTSSYSSSIFIDIKNNRGVAVFTNEASETSYTYGILEKLFGEYKYKKGEPNIEQNKEQNKEQKNIKREDLDESILPLIFTNSRANMKNGYGKFLKNISMLLPLVKGKNKNDYKLIIGDATLKKIDDGIYIFDNGNGFKSLKVLSKNGSTTYLEGYTSTDIKENTLIYLFKLSSMFLLFIGALISVILIVFKIIKYIIISIKYMSDNILKGNKNDGNKKINNFNNIRGKIAIIIFHTSNILIAFSTFNLLFSSNIVNKVDAMPFIIILIVFFIFLIVSFIERRKLGNKVSLLCKIILVTVIFDVIYWQLWNIFFI